MPTSSSFGPLDAAEGTAYTVLIHLAAVLSPLGGAATAIVLCTLVLRLALLPFALRSAQAVLLQLPFLFVLGRLLLSARVAGSTNALLHNTIFGVPLGARLLATGPAGLAVFGALAVLILLLAAWASWRAGAALRVAGVPANGLARVIPRVAPFASVLTLAFVPLAMGVYLATSIACGNLEATLRARRSAHQRE